MSALLDVENLSVDIPVPAGMLHPVQSIGFSLDKGETLCIVGESGCGKSLTALAIMGLLPKAAVRTAERLTLDGEDVLNAGEKRMRDLRGNRMGMIFYGLGCGIMIVFLRVWSTYTDGVVFACLLMNLFVPLLDKLKAKQTIHEPVPLPALSEPVEKRTTS